MHYEIDAMIRGDNLVQYEARHGEIRTSSSLFRVADFISAGHRIVVRPLGIIILFAAILSAPFLCGCAQGSTPPRDPDFEFVRRELDVREDVSDVLWRFRQNFEHDMRDEFTLIRAFCMRRQIARPTSIAIPLLTKHSSKILLGEPHATDVDGRWIYFFNTNRTWHISLEFRDEILFYTGFRQMESPSFIR